jgi:hypothetical protein
MPFDIAHVASTDSSGGEHAAAKTAIAGKVIAGHEQLDVDGTTLDLGDPAVGAKFAVVKAKAIEAGTYEGKGLKFGEGGRAKMFYDQLRVGGKTHEQANDIVKINFFNKTNQMKE